MGDNFGFVLWALVGYPGHVYAPKRDLLYRYVFLWIMVFQESKIMNVVNPQTVLPNELKSGDVMIVTVVCYIDKWDDQIIAKIYRAKYPFVNSDPLSIPQGPKVAEVTSDGSPGFDVMRLLFPVVMYAQENLKRKHT